jgi:hypothetical protein
MKKIMLWALVLLAIGVVTSCTFEGTATFHLENNTSHTITAVNFVAVVGGDTDNNPVTLASGDGRYFYRIEPGTYDINVTVSDIVGSFTAFNDFVVEEGIVYFRDLDDADLP